MASSTGRITLWGIEVFVAAAEESSITAAARRLGASPSAVSQQLTNLEGALGTALLNRNERPMSLTPAGNLFLRRAQAVLNEAARARAELAMQDLSTLTRLRLGMIEDFDSDVTPRLLRDMARDLTKCQFLLETGPSHRLIDKLDQRALDMVVVADIDAEADWMEVHPVLEEPFVAVVPKGSVPRDTDHLAVLRQMPLILYTERHHMGRMIASHLARQNLTLNYRFELDSYHAIMAMVAAGAGWTILTPLALLHAERFRDQADVLRLPFAPLGRTVSLTARKGVLEDIPAQTAARLRPLLKELILRPCVTELPWLEDTLRVTS
ncbi:Transcriptional regulator, LysR family [Candidatus Rhodobacter oscarellae]|uniref:Transcriptional regulator, LysR family n=1 Tax=Candidatus Rhodobacter oscarellae TaxID=1675527 RepID=A0A0J9EDV4_9RHOB|nr:LysR family transcriptional regulator [Candidatus Rhodobacter lobularis]KMW60806.1 Transcriptional regulator, LysR family [Candidatus Rhodobacter lobularis]